MSTKAKTVVDNFSIHGNAIKDVSYLFMIKAFRLLRYNRYMMYQCQLSIDLYHHS